MAGASGGDISGQKMRLADRWPGALWCDFGDSPELSAHLLGLIQSGAKTATCAALRDYEGDLPQAGDVMIARDYTGRADLVYELTEVIVRPFREVPEDFALAEGEGDFASWRAAHQAFFARNGGFDPEMKVVCERFRLVEVLP